jgi:transposase
MAMSSDHLFFHFSQWQDDYSKQREQFEERQSWFVDALARLRQRRQHSNDVWDTAKQRFNHPPFQTPLPVPVAHTDITDAQWQQILPLLPRPKGRGRRQAESRQILNGILYVTKTQCPWRQMPERYGHFTTCWRRLLQWQNQRVWEKILTVLAMEVPEMPHPIRPACDDSPEPASP